MPPQKRSSAKAKDSVTVDPPSAAKARTSSTTPSAKQVEAAVEKSAEYLEQQAAPPADIHPKPTTPSKAEVDAAIEQSAERLTASGEIVTLEARDKTMDAAPVAAGGANPGLDAAPVSAERDKTQDASPVFASPTLERPIDQE